MAVLRKLIILPLHRFAGEITVHQTDVVVDECAVGHCVYRVQSRMQNCHHQGIQHGEAYTLRTR